MVDRKQYCRRLPDESGKQCGAVLQSPVMEEKVDIPAFRAGPQMIEQIAAPADIEDRAARACGDVCDILPRMDGDGRFQHLVLPQDGAVEILHPVEGALESSVPFFQLRQPLRQGGGACVLGLGAFEKMLAACRWPGDGRGDRLGLDQPLLELMDALLLIRSFVGGGLQAQLLPNGLLPGLSELLFELCQAGDVEAACAADQMREHMHLAKDVADQGWRASRMAHQRPIGARNVAAVEAIAPDRAQFLLVRMAGNALDARLMALVERLVEELGRLVPLAGKTHAATALGLALCRLGRRVRFVTAAGLVTQLEEAQQEHRLDRLLTQLDRLDLLIVDELGYLSFSRAGAELLFQVFADRYERRSLLITSNLPFSEWGTVFQGERMTAALLDRLTHQCHIFEMNGESYRFRESMKAKKDKDAKKVK